MYIKIKVFTDQKHEKIEQISDTVFHIYVKQPAKQNLANKRIREILAQFYTVPISSVRMVAGHHKPLKICEITLPAVDSLV
jgi:uncharacterized protein YggU (UPF0235/DUF167 family)